MTKMGTAGNSASVSATAQRRLDLRFVELMEKVRRGRPGDDLELLRRAYDFAARQHAAQFRASGDPYLSHLLEVAHILADLRLDVTTLCAALLHDVVEDTRITIAQLSDHFGTDLARLVEGVTKISRLDLLAPEARQAENVRKMLLAMVNDVRVVLIKLADRLHNMRTLEYLPQDRRERIARETMEIYAPVANRLGMGLIRGELQDFSFQHLEPAAFLELRKRVESHKKVHERFLGEVQDVIRKKLVESGIPAEVEARIKRLYSLHLKIHRQERALEQVYDLLAVRVITDSERNCYSALGVIHQLWPPVPGRFKDYIAIPRQNLYQSLHTTVMHSGQPFEVQIRTQEMHRVAEQGVAAHWKYKDGKPVSARDDQRILWMRQLIDWVREMQEPDEFLSTLRVDLYPQEVYTFSPKGRVVPLPHGASPVDFAYAIHTEVGHQCAGAKVNGQIVPLRHKLTNGDVVEILTQKGHTPSRDWLKFVQTSRARGKILHWIHLRERDEATEVGRHLMGKEARQHGLSLNRISEQALQRVAVEYGCGRVNDLYAELGYGKWSARQVLAKAAGAPLTEQAEVKAPRIVSTVKRMLGLREPAISIRGHDDLMAYRAQCCNPIPGDPIIGYITRGRGVAVHGKTCPNVEKLLYDADRRITAEWSGSPDSAFEARLRVRALDRPGILANITAAVSNAGANIRNCKSGSSGVNARVELSVEVKNRHQLEQIILRVKKTTGIFSVERLYKV
jgi:GTP pyrophosphokinase